MKRRDEGDREAKQAEKAVPPKSKDAASPKKKRGNMDLSPVRAEEVDEESDCEGDYLEKPATPLTQKALEFF
jgi:hypothetical protein